MIEILQEVTEWGKYPVSNGIYHVNGAGQLVAYEGPTGLKEFKNPIKQFSKTRRKFKKIGERPEQLADNVIVVKGSNGKTYTIEDGKCSCPGYTFRGNCKHVK
ncbi:hypothetical protein N9C44_01265 [bacterium]|jgi:hypothetical protein|nr:hypothetical protein [bacterium]|tara:strand:- start:276 stop:584 length:309 start_codon:yes stop_codon:yes gene_type:complete